MSGVICYPFELRKCRPGSIAKFPGYGLVGIETADGFKRDISYSEYSEEGEYTEVVATVDVRDLVEIPLPDTRLCHGI